MTVRTLLPLALLLVAGCGDQGPVARDPAPDDPTGTHGPLVVVDGEVQVNCGGGATGWSPSVMAEGVEGLITDAEVDRAFAEALADADGWGPELQVSGILGDDPTTVEWRALTGSADTVALGIGSWTETRGELTVTLRREADGWSWRGHGDCQLEPALAEGASWVTVSRPGTGLDRSTTTPTLGVNERECTSGRDPSPYLHEPYVVERDDSVTVYWTAEAPGSDGGEVFSCQGREAAMQTLTLSEPLGDRELLDGSVYPPRPVGPAPF